MNIKIINAQQARLLNNFKNIRMKLLKCNASLWFNKQCLTLKYARTNIKPHNERNMKTQSVAAKYRLNLEIKYLYKKT